MSDKFDVHAMLEKVEQQVEVAKEEVEIVNRVTGELDEKQEHLAAMDVVSAKDWFDKIRSFKEQCMVDDIDFGIIEGVKKPSLFKPGAEKLLKFCGYAVTSVNVIEHKDWNATPPLFDYRIETTVSSLHTGKVEGIGVGECNSYEPRYKYRQGSRACPQCGEATIFKSKNHPFGWYCWTKKGGCGQQFQPGDKSIEGQDTGRTINPDIAEQKNTIMKMAKKRSVVDAALIATGASEIFTQDVEDFKGSSTTPRDVDTDDYRDDYEPPVQRQAAKPAPKTEVIPERDVNADLQQEGDKGFLTELDPDEDVTPVFEAPTAAPTQSKLAAAAKELLAKNEDVPAEESPVSGLYNEAETTELRRNLYNLSKEQFSNRDLALAWFKEQGVEVSRFSSILDLVNSLDGNEAQALNGLLTSKAARRKRA